MVSCAASRMAICANGALKDNGFEFISSTYDRMSVHNVPEAVTEGSPTDFDTNTWAMPIYNPRR